MIDPLPPPKGKVLVPTNEEDETLDDFVEDADIEFVDAPPA